jgi:hypothetical protein
MKRIYYYFFLILLSNILLTLISSCRSTQLFKHKEEVVLLPDTTPIIICDTLLAGRIKTTAIFENYWNDTLTNTFIITENYTISISGKHEIPDNVSGFIYIFDNNRMKAFFTWSGDTTLHKILK